MENFIFCEVAVARKEPCSCGDYAYTKLLQEIRYLEKCNGGLSGHPLAILANFIRELSLWEKGLAPKDVTPEEIVSFDDGLAASQPFLTEEEVVAGLLEDKQHREKRNLNLML